MELVTFTLAGKEYAVDITQVHEVTKIKEITPIPSAPDFVEGVINLRGRVVSLISMRKKLGLPEQELTRSNRIIITLVNNHFIGIIVDGAIDVTSLAPADISPPDEVLKKAEYLTGVGKVGKRLILVVDIGNLLTDKEKINIEDIHRRVEIRKKN